MTSKILASIFGSDFSNIPAAIETILKAEITMIHYDVMDNHFVPNISFGHQFIQQLMKTYPAFDADIHLMIDLPGNWTKYLELKPKSLTIHAEAGDKYLIKEILKTIRAEGVLAGLSIKPQTPVKIIEDFLSEIDLLLIMTVEPGFSFQSFIPESIPRIQEAKKMCGDSIILEADGGINRSNMHKLKEIGLDWLVMGGGLFKDSMPSTLLSDFHK